MSTTHTAKADVSPIRQRTQYTCMSTSMAMALQALGHDLTEDEVNRVMGARAMQGASWEQALACAQHYGCRATLTMPSTVGQLKKWTDNGTPVMIAWNPEGREWSHASLVYDVTDKLPNPIPAFATVISDKAEGGLWVWVADPNIPNPEKTVRIVSDNDFYSKWFEKWPNYLVRRPACAIEREISTDGKQVSPKTASARERVAMGQSAASKRDIFQDVIDFDHQHSTLGSDLWQLGNVAAKLLKKIPTKNPKQTTTVACVASFIVEAFSLSKFRGKANEVQRIVAPLGDAPSEIVASEISPFVRQFVLPKSLTAQEMVLLGVHLLRIVNKNQIARALIMWATSWLDFNEHLPTQRVSSDLGEALRMATSVRDDHGRVWEPRRGLEGPFKFRGGEVLYYDPRAKGGSYYNPLTDTYLDHQEATRITMRSAKDTAMHTASSYDAAMKAWLKASEAMSDIRNKIIAAEKALKAAESRDSADEYNKLMELEEEYDKVMEKHDKAYRSMVMGGWGEKSAGKKQKPITGPGVTPRNPVVQGLIERGQGGAGKHKDRGRDFDRGNARSPKHRNKDIEAASTPRLAFDNPDMADAAIRRIASKWRTLDMTSSMLPELARLLASLDKTAAPNYTDYVRRQKNKNKPVLKKDDWERRVLNRGKKDEGGGGKKKDEGGAARVNSDDMIAWAQTYESESLKSVGTALKNGEKPTPADLTKALEDLEKALNLDRVFSNLDSEGKKEMKGIQQKLKSMKDEGGGGKKDEGGGGKTAALSRLRALDNPDMTDAAIRRIVSKWIIHLENI